MRPRFLTYPDIGWYGYHWWVNSFKFNDHDQIDYYFAMGLFGQFVIVLPALDMVAVFVSENYGSTMLPLQYLRDLLLTDLESAGAAKKQS